MHESDAILLVIVQHGFARLNVDIMADDRRPPSQARGVRPASPASGEAGPAASDTAPAWLDVPDEEAPRRRRWVLAAAVLPWVVLAALVVRAPASERPATTATETPASPDPEPTAPLTTANPTVGPSDVAQPTARADVNWPQPVQLPGARSSLGLADVAAAAIPIVRAWLGAAQPLAAEGIEQRAYGWLDHATVEAVDYPGMGAAVASVLAVVLPAQGDEWLDARLVRVAVPLRIRAGQVLPAGSPWLLPPPILAAEPLELTPVEDDELVAAAGLVIVETYPDVVEFHGLFATESWPYVADVTMADPLDGATRRVHIWMRPSASGMSIAGWFQNPPESVRFPRMDGETTSPAGESASAGPSDGTTPLDPSTED